MTALVWLAAWPVLDEDAPMPELEAQAAPELLAQVAASGYLPAGPPVWAVREGHVLGVACPTGLWLCAEVPLITPDSTPLEAPMHVVPDPTPDPTPSAARSLDTMSRAEALASAEVLLPALVSRYGAGSPQVLSAVERWEAAIAGHTPVVSPVEDELSALVDVVAGAR